MSGWRRPGEGVVAGADEDGQEGARTPLPDCEMMQVSAPISPGSSGGPVFDHRGRVVGMATAGVTYGAQNLNFAVPASAIAPLLELDRKLDFRRFQAEADAATLELARPQFERARLEYERRSMFVAMRLLRLALLHLPRYTDALLLGSVSMRSEDLSAAYDAFRSAQRADADSALAELGLAHVEMLRQKPHEAASHFRQFFRLAEDQPGLRKQVSDARQFVDKYLPRHASEIYR